MEYLLDRCSFEQVLFFHEKAIELEEKKAIIQAVKLREAFFGKPKTDGPLKPPSEQMREIYGTGQVVRK